MENLELTQEPGRSKRGVFAGGALLIGCCVIAPLLIGAACAFSIGVFGELAIVAGALAIVGLALRRRRASRSCC